MKGQRWVWLTLITVATGAAGPPSNIVPPPHIEWSGLEQQDAPPPPPRPRPRVHAKPAPVTIDVRQSEPESGWSPAERKLYREFKAFLDWKKNHPQNSGNEAVK